MRVRDWIPLTFTCAALACSGEAAVPSSPTWVDDVQPILRGNCLQCHGATASKSDRVMRWDVCDLTAFSSVGPFAMDPIHASPDDPEVEFIGASKRFPLVFERYLLPHPELGSTRVLMPPLPAPLLTAHQTDVMAAWVKNPVCGSRVANDKPTAAWQDPQAKSTVLIEDGDRDQVLGTITCGTVTATIFSSGAQPLPAGASPPCTLKLSDGQDSVTVTLD